MLGASPGGATTGTGWCGEQKENGVPHEELYAAIIQKFRALVIPLLLCACKRTPPMPFPVTNNHVEVPSAFTQCETDADCMIISRGCCYETPVNRQYEKEAREGMPADYCPPKAACGPSIHGTWDGEPGVCLGNVCKKYRPPPIP